MVQENEIKIPKHIAFIMDGNGRWAKRRGLSRKIGHKMGAESMKKVIQACNDSGVQICTLYAFSTENWKRPQEEIDAIFELVNKFAKEDLDEYANKGYRVSFMGDLSQLPNETKDSINKIIEKSKLNTGMVVNIALNYGGRQEIVHAVNKILQSGISSIDEQMLSDCMYTCGYPDPDVIVRTSGEERLSNFMLWQSAYSELIFLDTYWPDMDDKSVKQIIKEYSSRNRRFGK